MAGRRIDVELVRRGLADSREQAQAAILAGKVTVNGLPVTKPGAHVDPAADICLVEGPRFVSRGGVKLAHALDVFGIDPTGTQAIDIGASTGGFTDCLLQRGAARVTAVDVGYGQLAWSLRNDPRVVVRERTNARDADLGGPYDLATVDVSFISLSKILPTVVRCVSESGSVLALVKPQFEVGKGRVGKKGVVRDPVLHREVLEAVITNATALGWIVRGLAWSPIKGPEGNIEFWVWLARTGKPTPDGPGAVVTAAHEALGG